jgi:hypothetical protein
LAAEGFQTGPAIGQRTCPELLQGRIPTRTTSAEGELALSDLMCELDARQRDGGRAERLEGEHRCATALDRSVVLLDNVVEISAATNQDSLPPGILLPQQPQHPVTRGVASRLTFPGQRGW